MFNHNQFSKSVNIPNPLYQSLQGRYFVGQTDHIRFGKGKNAWGGLINPFKSNVNLFVNAFTITNHSNQPFEAEIWFNPIPPGKLMISNNVTPATQPFPRSQSPKEKSHMLSLLKEFQKEG